MKGQVGQEIEILRVEKKVHYLRIRCVKCYKPMHFTVLESELTAWDEGVHVQKAMKNLTTDQREMFISGLCPACWNRVFNGKTI